MVRTLTLLQRLGKERSKKLLDEFITTCPVHGPGSDVEWIIFYDYLGADISESQLEMSAVEFSNGRRIERYDDRWSVGLYWEGDIPFHVVWPINGQRFRWNSFSWGVPSSFRSTPLRPCDDPIGAAENLLREPSEKCICGFFGDEKLPQTVTMEPKLNSFNKSGYRPIGALLTCWLRMSSTTRNGFQPTMRDGNDSKNGATA